jgi:hypothetical protein
MSYDFKDMVKRGSYFCHEQLPGYFRLPAPFGCTIDYLLEEEVQGSRIVATAASWAISDDVGQRPY